MSVLTATQQPAPHSALRRLVARHPVAAFLVMVYAVNIAVALPTVRTHLASCHSIWSYGRRSAISWGRRSRPSSW
jgi:hypothetical protein